MKFDSSVAIKAGLIGAAAGLLVALIGRIPFIGCIVAPLAWLVAVASGVLYVYFAISGGAKVELVEGALGGGIAGGIAGLVNGLVSGVLTLAFGAVGTAASLIGGGELGSAALSTGANVAGVIVSMVGGAVAGVVLGAIGGLVFALIKGAK